MQNKVQDLEAKLNELKQTNQAPLTMTLEAFSTLQGCLYKYPDGTRESPLDMYKRVARTAAEYYEDVNGYEDIYDDFLTAISNNWLGLATPIAANLGTPAASLPISCLETGTLINVKSGYKQIQDILIGDLVFTHLGNWKPVVARKSRRTTNDLYKFTVKMYETIPLYITGNHQVLTNNGWKRIDELGDDRIVVENDGSTDITFGTSEYKLEKESRETTVWDIEVADDHSFVAQGVVVHNCFVISVDDSINGIFDSLHEASILTKVGGGVGIDLTSIRAQGDSINGGGNSNGAKPWATIYDIASGIVSQAGVRRGQFSFNIDIESPDLWDFLLAKDHSKGDPRKHIHSNICVNVTDSFMEKLYSNDSEAINIWNAVLRTRLISGSPYLHFIDNANRDLVQCMKDEGFSVSSTNICCFEENTLVLTSLGSYPIKDLVNKTVEIYDGENWVSNSNFALSGKSKLIQLTLKNGEVLKLTPNHRCLIESDSRSKIAIEIEARDIEIGQKLLKSCDFSIKGPDNLRGHYEMELVSNNGTQVVDSLYLEGEYDVYCTKVPSTSYFTLANGILIGNTEITSCSNKDLSMVCCLASENLYLYDNWKNWIGKTGLGLHELGIFFLDAVMQNFIDMTEDTKRFPKMERARAYAINGRPLGLGVFGYHAYLMRKRWEFNSIEANFFNDAFFHKQSKDTHAASLELAQLLGEAPWAAGRRNIQTTAIAPTVGNSVVNDGVSPGIEPLEANYYEADGASGSFKRKNPILKEILENRGYDNFDIWESIISNAGSVQHLSSDILSDKEKAIFKTFNEIDQKSIIIMAALRQKYLEQTQSVNLSFDLDASSEYISDVHLLAEQLGLHSLYYLRSESIQKKSLRTKETDLRSKETYNVQTDNKDSDYFEIITKDGCIWCEKSIELLQDRNKKYSVFNSKDENMFNVPKGYTTYPKIFRNGHFMEGYRSLKEYFYINGTVSKGPESCSSCDG